MKVSWSALAQMLATHHLTCGRPRYVRALVFYGKVTEAMYDMKIGPSLCLWFPALFGAKAVICLTCKNYAFESKFSGRVLSIIRLVQSAVTGLATGERDEAVLYDEDDASHYTDEELSSLGFVQEKS